MQIDMKNAMIRIRDGTTKAGAVNNGAGYAATATVLAVDGFTGAVTTGARLVITNTDGSKSEYVISAHTETTGNTTGITLSTGLKTAVSDDAVITTYPNELSVKVGEGNLTYSEKVNREYTRDRGALDTVRNGDEEPVEVQLDAVWEWLRASTGATPTIEDALKKRGVASAWASSSADACEPYAVDIEIHYVPDCGTEETEVILLEDFRYESLDHDLSAGTISVSGKCNRTTATVERLDWTA